MKEVVQMLHLALNRTFDRPDQMHHTYDTCHQSSRCVQMHIAVTSQTVSNIYIESLNELGIIKYLPHRLHK